jgi:hypothetical protein
MREEQDHTTMTISAPYIQKLPPPLICQRNNFSHFLFEQMETYFLVSSKAYWTIICLVFMVSDSSLVNYFWLLAVLNMSIQYLHFCGHHKLYIVQQVTIHQPLVLQKMLVESLKCIFCQMDNSNIHILA